MLRRMQDDKVLAETRYLRFIERNGWSFVERPNVSGVVIVAAVTKNDRVLFVEQHRPPIGTSCIELPAGLAGDEPGTENEPTARAADRELQEETGYKAGVLRHAADCLISPGMTTESVSLYVAWDLEKVSGGGGVAGENITVHEVPMGSVEPWLSERTQPIAATVYTGLHFLHAMRPK